MNFGRRRLRADLRQQAPRPGAMNDGRGSNGVRFGQRRLSGATARLTIPVETGGSPTVDSASYNVTYSNSLIGRNRNRPRRRISLGDQRSRSSKAGPSAQRGSSGSGSSSSSSGASSSASAESSGSSGSSSSSSSSSSGSGSSSSSSNSSAPGATGNAPAAAAAGPSARAVQAPPLPNSGGMMVAAGAMTMPAMNGMSFGGGSGASDGFQAEDDGGQPPWYAQLRELALELCPHGNDPGARSGDAPE